MYFCYLKQMLFIFTFSAFQFQYVGRVIESVGVIYCVMYCRFKKFRNHAKFIIIIILFYYPAIFHFVVFKTCSIKWKILF